MKIGGWRTRSVFERYAIVSRGDIVGAMRKLQINQQESEIGHEIGHGAQPDLIDAPPGASTKALESMLYGARRGN